MSASAALLNGLQRVGTTTRRATQLPTARPSGCATAKAGSTWAGPHRCRWRRHQSLLEDRVTRNNDGRVGRTDD
jgi:hypothetical protein